MCLIRCSGKKDRSNPLCLRDWPTVQLSKRKDNFLWLVRYDCFSVCMYTDFATNTCRNLDGVQNIARVSGRLMPGPEQRRHRPELFPEGEACAIHPASMLSSTVVYFRRLIASGNNHDRQVARSTRWC